MLRVENSKVLILLDDDQIFRIFQNQHLIPTITGVTGVTVTLKRSFYVLLKVRSRSGISDLSRIWLSCLDPLVYYFQTLLNYLALKYFDIERTTL